MTVTSKFYFLTEGATDRRDHFLSDGWNIESRKKTISCLRRDWTHHDVYAFQPPDLFKPISKQSITVVHLCRLTDRKNGGNVSRLPKCWHFQQRPHKWTRSETSANLHILCRCRMGSFNGWSPSYAQPRFHFRSDTGWCNWLLWKCDQFTQSFFLQCYSKFNE